MNLIISLKTIFVSLLVVFLLWAAFQIREIIVTLFVAMLLAMALAPLIKRLQEKKLSRGLSTLLVYLFFILVVVFVLGYGLSPLVEQTALFLTQLPKLLNVVLSQPLVEPLSQQIISGLSSQLSVASGNIIRLTINLFSSFLSLITLTVFSFYFSLEFESLKERFLSLFPREESRLKAAAILAEVEQVIGSWVRGELVLMLVIGLATYLGLTLLKVNYALPLSVIAGVLEIVPTLGPIVSAVPAAVVGFSASPLLGLGVVALFVLIQQLENSLVVPRVMHKAIGLDPLVILLAILVGGRVLGVLGALLSVPVTLVAIIIIRKLYYSNN